MTDQSVSIWQTLCKEEMHTMEKVSRDSIARVARMYKQNRDASAALGISLRYSARLCRQYEVETPYARHRRHIQEAKH